MSLRARTFKVVAKAAEKLTALIPDAPADPLIAVSREIGRPVNRLDGPAKVSGRAPYTADSLTNVAQAVLVGSTIARGRITSIDVSAAAAQDGVLLVITHHNAPRMKPTPAFTAIPAPLAASAISLPILNTDEIFWNGQPVAVIVAETLEQARHAATLVQIAYEPAAAALSLTAERPRAFTPTNVAFEESEINIGDADGELTRSAAVIDQVYTTPAVNHSAIELHATVARWEGRNLTVFDATQYPYGVKEMLARKFGLSKNRVRVIAPYSGGGFGGKSAAWPHVSLAVAAAKLAKRPVKLVLSRSDTFYMTGPRSPAEQRVALGASRDGKLTAIVHEGVTMCTKDVFGEPVTAPSRHLYACPNIRLHQQVVPLDRIQNTFMRAPGFAPGSFALESAMDELAWQLRIDPIELRLRNEPLENPTKRTRFSSRYLRETCDLGARAFGWQVRSEPRTMRDGQWLCGYGMSSVVYPVYQFTASVAMRLDRDGEVTIESGHNELGTGTSTAQSQAAADRLGIPLAKVHFFHGDSAMSVTRTPGGSSATATIGAAVWAARDKLVQTLLSLLRGTDSPLAHSRLADVETRNEGVFLRADPKSGETYREILARLGRDSIEVTGSFAFPYKMLKYSMNAYGAHFCEVRVDEDTGEIRVARWAGAFDAGRILNPKQAHSQVAGGIVMGIGMALTEETILDERSGRIPNRSLAEYHVPTHADIPDIQVHLLDRADPVTPLGAKGIGELSIVGAAAAIANAVYHATGVRVRRLPITLDTILGKSRPADIQ